MKNILLGLVIMGVGILLIYFSPVLTKAFGRSSWAERNLGGTRNAIVLFGVVVIVISVLMMFGLFDAAQHMP